MSIRVEGLHHVTAICASAPAHDRFLRAIPGLARVKVTVNFDAPDHYHLYYGVDGGRPGTILTWFATPHRKPGARGAGEVAVIQLRTGQGSLKPLDAALRALGCRPVPGDWFGRPSLRFAAPDGEVLEIVENGAEEGAAAVTGLSGVVLRVARPAPTVALLERMGYSVAASHGAVTLMHIDGNGANEVAVEAVDRGMPRAGGGPGSVHHIAFAVADEAALAAARETLAAEGVEVTGIRDRKYFRSIYFREPGGVLFEFATNPPGFAVDEPADALGRRLCLPDWHEPLRSRLEATLEPLEAMG